MARAGLQGGKSDGNVEDSAKGDSAKRDSAKGERGRRCGWHVALAAGQSATYISRA